MKLSGDYSLAELVRAFQGNFECQSVVKDSKNKPLGDGEYIRLQLYFLRFDVYPKQKKVVVYRVGEAENAQQNLQELGTIKME